jgi:type IX secretion system PorP/SprF family membrane protein
MIFMKLLKPLLFLTFSLLIGSMTAQDLHYTLYNMSPLTLNPALSGAFSGTVRIGGLYRNQAFSVSNSRSYSTPSFYADAPVVRGFRKGDWVGAGISFVSDKSGELRLETTRATLSASYHLALDNAGKSILTLGLQGGSTTRKYDATLGTYSDTFNASLGGTGVNTSNDPLRSDQTEAKKALTDFAGGLLFRTVINNDSKLELGFSTGHITQPIYSFNGGSGDSGKRPLLFSAHARYETPLTEKWSIAPSAFWQKESEAMEILFQAWGGYQLNPDFKLNFGLGYRFGDAMNVLAGCEFKDLRVALAYDITLSSLNDANNYSGGVELAAYYIIKKYKQPEIKPKVLCPRF